METTDGEILFPPIEAAATPQQFRAALTLAVSLLVGVVGNLLLYSTGEGINLPIFIMIFLVVLLGTGNYLGRLTPSRNLLFLIPSLFAGWMLSLRSAPELVVFNLGMSFGAVFILARYGHTTRFLGGSLKTFMADGIRTLSIGWLIDPIEVIGASFQWFSRQHISNEQGKKLIAIGRGIALTIPVLLVFGLLLASADVVFGDFLYDTLGFFQPNVFSLITRSIIIAMIAWGSMAALQLGLNDANPVREYSSAKSKPFFQLSMIETSMVLGSANALFLVFILIQARYLFGGEANITAQGYTYAEYARRGFSEILMVSIMVVGLLLSLDLFTHRKRDREYLFRSLAIGMILLTLLLLVAAFQRLLLYEDAFGFTRRRVMTQVLMLWLGVVFLFLIRDIVIRQNRIFWIGCILAGMGLICTLNLMNMDGFIAGRNIERFDRTGKIDIDYLLSLSDDAIPTIAPLLERDELLTGGRIDLQTGLRYRLSRLEAQRTTQNWLGYHFGKNRAYHALDAYRDKLE